MSSLRISQTPAGCLDRSAPHRPSCRRQPAAVAASRAEALALGLDFGTSGARATVLNQNARVLEEHRREYATGAGQAESWAE